MPINQIKSFAKQSGKSENEVEKLYQKAKDIAKESEREEDYGYIIGILKKMLKLEEKTEMDKEFLQSIKPEILEHILEYVKEQGIEDITKEMVLEMKETYEKVIEEKKGDKKEYTEFFQKTLEKYGVKSPSELSEEDKKKFYEEIDSGWESDIEEKTVEDKLTESLALLSSGDNIGFSMAIKDVLYEILSENEKFIEIKELSKQYT